MDTIEAVVRDLDAAITRSRNVGSRLGYFPALYRKVTLRVEEAIDAGEFDDGARMTNLLVTFARRYLDALGQFDAGVRPTVSWQVSFGAADDSSLIVLQHLLLAFNAHINLDLGIVAATVSEGANLPELRSDFDRINEILESLIDEVNTELTEVWPPLRVLNIFGRTASGRVTDFSMRQAREHAWAFANELAEADPNSWTALIEQTDRKVALLARLVERPPLMMRLLLRGIRLHERGTVVDRIDWLVD